MVKTLPSSVGGVGSVPGLEAKIPYASQPKNHNKSNSNNFNKYFENDHIQKSLKQSKEDKRHRDVLKKARCQQRQRCSDASQNQGTPRTLVELRDGRRADPGPLEVLTSLIWDF